MAPRLQAAAAVALMVAALLADPATAARLAPAHSRSSSEPLAFKTSATVAFGRVGTGAAGGRGMKLQPAGCGGVCNGYTQSSGEEHTNEMYVFGLQGAGFSTAPRKEGGDDAEIGGLPNAFLRVQLRNRGLQLPADAPAPAANITVRFSPAAVGGAPAAAGEPFEVTIAVAWTTGPGAPRPNSAALFSLVPPLAEARFMANGRLRRFRVTGLGLPELARATGVEGRQLPWATGDPDVDGYSSVVMPEERCKWFIEVLGRVEAV